MKAPPYFIIIPSGCKTFYIKPMDIVYLEEGGMDTTIWFKRGEDVVSLDTRLTAKEIHERILELEEENFKFTWGGDG